MHGTWPVLQERFRQQARSGFARSSSPRYNESDGLASRNDLGSAVLPPYLESLALPLNTRGSLSKRTK